MGDGPATIQKKYLTTPEAAKYLGMSSKYLEMARWKGGGPLFIKLSRAVRYRIEDLDEFMLSHQQEHT